MDGFLVSRALRSRRAATSTAGCASVARFLYGAVDGEGLEGGPFSRRRSISRLSASAGNEIAQ